MTVQGESLVLAGTSRATSVLTGWSTEPNPASTFVPGMQGEIVYTEGRDYVVDYAKGTITRTTGSRIFDYSTNSLYGRKDFDHNKFSGYENYKWFVWATYQTTNGKPWAKPNDQSRYLVDMRKKLESGGPFKIASYGDSITGGGQASKMEFQFTSRFANYLQAKFPNSKIGLQDVSIPGYGSERGVALFDKKMGPVAHPDLALVGFGMNDHNNLAVGGVEPETFKNNLVVIVKRIKERKGADVILFSACPPHDDWHYGTHRMAQFAAATRQAAAEAKCAYVDVFGTWEMVLKRKDQSSLLYNNINHPNDFGHWLYEQAFEAMKF